MSWLPVAAWCGLIFAGSCVEGSPNPNPAWADWFLRKSAHVGEYGVLFLLTRRALGGKHGLWAFLFCLAYAAGDEFHQTFVPYRDGNPRDVLIDAFGAALAWRLGPRA